MRRVCRINLSLHDDTGARFSEGENDGQAISARP
ncbi:hypothetical protein Pecwa_3598 [Pectobacterium parmentieri WPP163]|nr:hypothetical protein Pecwa_3598 [Pectobacterium parmentieri WPP163]